MNTGGHAIVYSTQDSAPPTVGQQLSADQLPFPYLFEVSAAVDEG